MEILWLLGGVGIGIVAMRWRRPSPLADALPASPQEPESARDRLFRLKRAVEERDDAIQHPQDLLAQPEFREAVSLLATDAFSVDELVEFLGSGGYVLPCAAAVAAANRDDVPPENVVAATDMFGSYPLRFVLDFLQGREAYETLPQLLRHARAWWWDSGGVRDRLREFFRSASGTHAPADHVDFAAMRDDVLDEQATTLAQFREPLLAPYLQRLHREQARRREQRVLGGIGRVVCKAANAHYFPTTARTRVVGDVLDVLRQERPRSVLMAGLDGAGKSTLAEEVTRRLQAEGWLVFEASAADVLAGQKYIGELEARLREMFAALDRPRALWRVPDFADLLHKGAHAQDPRGILDLVLPAVERGELLLLGELTPQQLAHLDVTRPAVRRLFEVVTVPPPSPSELSDIANQWARAAAPVGGEPVADERVLAEAMQLAAHFFADRPEPARLLRLLDDALQVALARQPAESRITNEMLLEAIASRSGLPLNVVDERQSLDLEEVRGFFRKRVLGQEEAIDCIVDRIAMLKAGLVDPGRPIGVFLFAGPTGTGKTELAKALGELLFGSAERLVRLDMSEFQSDDASWRMLEEGAQGGSRSLTARVRAQPFSVVLLDEFEKAHPRVWDLFLQVFDDARLSDRKGNTTDFRQTIIILTSNVGSTLARHAGPGFTSAAGGYSRSAVEKALNETFRREFLNRLDRVVLFKPLDRALMRDILRKELRDAFERRGLRIRDWAVEWDPSAIEFLLDRGFTPDLGARPLRRAIEHHLLAPLARAIVEHRAPEGGQFLFVRGEGNRLAVEFVDPDAPDDDASAARAAGGHDELRGIVHAPGRGTTDLDVLVGRLDTLRATLDGRAWQTARENDFAAMGTPGFWEDGERFAVLDRIERRDRIESATEAASRLAGRLRHEGGNRSVASRLAQLLFLLGPATDALLEGRAQDALIEVRCNAGTGKVDADTRLWWQAMLRMYRAWAQRRNMRIEVVEEDPQHCLGRFSVTGFAAYDLLLPEAGLHVFEQERDDGSVRRVVAHVRVFPDLPGRTRRFPDGMPDDARIVRRYRETPAPLVRDSVRGWRTGRLDRVLDGEFDVMQGAD